jgi:hypothetical protein
MNEGLTASDVLALTRNNNEEGMWNNPFIYLVWLAVLGNGGLFGNRGIGDAAVQGAITRSDLFEGFNTQDINGQLRGITNGLCDGFYAVNTSLLTGFNGIQSLTASCCCDTQRSIDGLGRNIDSVRYDMATGFCGLGNTINNASRDIIDNQNANYRGIMDFLVGEKLASKDARIVELTNQISQLNQNAVLGARIDAAVAEVLRRTGHECPTAAYLVNAPTPVSFPTNSCGQVQFGGYGCGCGC